eukprot:4998534-Prymnesium_polylepis.1
MCPGRPVEANFEGKGLWFAGIMQQIFECDSTAIVCFSDGDRRRESLRHVRPITLDDGTLRAGLSVEVQVELGRWEMATVVHRNDNGTWAVKIGRWLMEHELPINIRIPVAAST